MLEFKELLTILHETHPQPNPNYYMELLNHADVIVLEVGLRGQQVVSKELGMVQSKLSAYMPLLKSYVNNNRGRLGNGHE